MYLAEISSPDVRVLMTYMGYWMTAFGLLMLTVAFIFECVRETALNSRWQVPPESRPTRRYFVALLFAGLLGLAGAVLVVFGLLSILSGARH